MRIIYMALYIYTAYYTVRYAMMVKREGNTPAAIAIGVLSALVLASSIVTLYLI